MKFAPRDEQILRHLTDSNDWKIERSTQLFAEKTVSLKYSLGFFHSYSKELLNLESNR